jgi:hypothetical protein
MKRPINVVIASCDEALPFWNKSCVSTTRHVTVSASSGPIEPSWSR